MGYVNIGFIEYCQAGEKMIRHTRKFIDNLHQIVHQMNSMDKPADSTFFDLNQKGCELIEKWISDVTLATECLEMKKLRQENYVTSKQINKNYDPDIENLFDDDHANNTLQ
jgi:hypothetical protein